MRFVFVAKLGDEANIGICFDHVRQMFDLSPRGLVQNAALARCRTGAFLLAVEVTQVARRSDNHSVEQAGLHQTARRELLQADPQREHGDQRSYTYGNADGGQRISQKRFAQIAHREFRQIGKLHRGTPTAPAGVAALDRNTPELDSSPTSLPSARKMRRWA